MTYNYYQIVREDLIQFINDNFYELMGCNACEISLNEAFSNVYNNYREEAANSDFVTGNISGSYTCNRELAKKYVVDNIELLNDTIDYFDEDYEYLGKKIYFQDWELLDVMIRIYLVKTMDISDLFEQVKRNYIDCLEQA